MDKQVVLPADLSSTGREISTPDGEISYGRQDKSAGRPEKPSPDFPLYAHPKGRWAKKINGKIKYFGHWDDPDGALAEYQDSIRIKLTRSTGLSIGDACNLFLLSKRSSVESKTLSLRTFNDYKRTCKRLIESLGRDRTIQTLRPLDFLAYKTSFSKTNNPVSVGNEITRIKSLLKWLKQAKHCSEIEVGPDFRKPSAKAARAHKREMGLKLFTAAQIHSILDESGLRMRAMVLLGINCGYHNSDVETISLASVNAAIKSGTIEHARSKTEVERACPLWQETKQALQAYVERRPKTDSKRAFVLPDGRQLSAINNDVAKRFRAVRDAAQITDGGFSWLRKTFATYASESQDQVAVNFIMGHVDSHISGVYRQLVRSKRLDKVVEVVREWFLANK